MTNNKNDNKEIQVAPRRDISNQRAKELKSEYSYNDLARYAANLELGSSPIEDAQFGFDVVYPLLDWLGKKPTRRHIEIALMEAVYAGEMYELNFFMTELLHWENALFEAEKIFARLEEIAMMLAVENTRIAPPLRASLSSRRLDKELAAHMMDFELYSPEKWKDSDAFQGVREIAANYKEGMHAFTRENDPDNGEQLIAAFELHSQKKHLIEELAQAVTKLGRKPDRALNWFVPKVNALKRELEGQRYEWRKDILPELLRFLRLETAEWVDGLKSKIEAALAPYDYENALAAIKAYYDSGKRTPR